MSRPKAGSLHLEHIRRRLMHGVLTASFPLIARRNERPGVHLRILIATYRGARGTAPQIRVHTCLHPVMSIFPRDRWHLKGPNGRETIELQRAAVEINLPDALGVALREGVSVGARPMSSALPLLDSGALVRVLPQYRLQKLTAFTVHASSRYLDAKVSTFVDFLRESVPLALAEDEAALGR